MDRKKDYIDPTNRALREGIDTLDNLSIIPEIDRLAGYNYPIYFKRTMAVMDGTTLGLASIGMHNGDWTTTLILVGVNIFLKVGLSGVIREKGNKRWRRK